MEVISKSPRCIVVMYHYVRDLPRTPFPRIRGLLTRDFRLQLDSLQARYEMATMETALAFWYGQYVPKRDLCLLTFDDGLKDHYTDVLPILVERKIEGLFFVITSCIEEKLVAAVHKNHFLMAALGFGKYRQAFLERLAELSPGTDLSVDTELVGRTYRWDGPEVAAFKYLLNFRIGESTRDRILTELFLEHFGSESEFSRDLYFSWEEAREMQQEGAILGGHSHKHVPLATLPRDQQQRDLELCSSLLRERLALQAIWPFSYPYGKRETFTEQTTAILQRKAFACAFSTVPGETQPGDDVFMLRRTDTNSLCQLAREQ